MLTKLINEDIKPLVKQKEVICNNIKRHPKFNGDLTEDYIWNPNDHPYKNLGNYIAWCDTWFKKIKDLNPKRTTEYLSDYQLEIATANQSLTDELNNGRNLVIEIKNKWADITEADYYNNYPQYKKEQMLLEEIDSRMDFLKPFARNVYESLCLSKDTIHKDRKIIEEFRQIFINNYKHEDDFIKLKADYLTLTEKYGDKKIKKLGNVLGTAYNDNDFFEIVSRYYHRVIGEYFGQYIDATEFADDMISYLFGEIDTCRKAYDFCVETMKNIMESDSVYNLKNSSDFLRMYNVITIPNSRDDRERCRHVIETVYYKLIINHSSIGNISKNLHWQTTQYHLLCLVNNFVINNIKFLEELNIREDMFDYLRDKNLHKIYKVILNLAQIVDLNIRFNDTTIKAKIKSLYLNCSNVLKINNFKIIRSFDERTI